MSAPCDASREATPIRTRSGRRSRTAGGYAFAIDPDVSATQEPAFWLPEHSPGTLILAPAPPGFDLGAPFDPALLGQVLAERASAFGRELAIRDDTGDVHIWLLDDEAARHPAVVVPPGGALRLRLDLASRFVRRLLGEKIGLVPPKLQLTAFQRQRYIQLLHAADIYEAGGEPRDVAARVLRSAQANLPAIEFKDTAARKQAARLIAEAVTLVSHGYLKLLRGD
jgi:hypothetical protein